MTKRPIAIDLFAGSGGMSLGLEAAGFDVAVAVEFDAVHSLVHHYNFPYCKTICKDVSQVSSLEILQALVENGDRKDIDLIAGGPPCQGFSHIGKRQLNDPRNSLVFEYHRIISELRPKYFIFENVPGITTGKHRQFLTELIAEFETIGYRIDQPIKILDASEFGAPQKRKRLILIGSRNDVNLAKYPLPRYGQNLSNSENLYSENIYPFRTVYDAIADLSKIKAYTDYDPGINQHKLNYQGDRLQYALKPSGIFAKCHTRTVGDLVFGHLGSLHTQQSIDRFSDTEPGKIEPKSRFFKLSKFGLCNTLRAGTNSDKGAFTAPRPIHYSEPRCITIREAARLHTFPDWFRFHRTIWHGFREIGNAVIPALSKEIGDSIIHALGINPEELATNIIDRVEDEILSYKMSQASAYWGIADDVIPKRKRLA
ncbi:DNA (cytosine-5-)-methyltransferase [Oscillatoriales cyanobacterium USR001]|nr:DNA (cytosine-5-)-methyltransferase [Oscillatoriales cyanobacterium USR001]